MGDVITPWSEFADWAEIFGVKMWSLHIHISPFRVPYVPASCIGKHAGKTRTKTEQNHPLPEKYFFIAFTNQGL
jgi:hypothetical protein